MKWFSTFAVAAAMAAMMAGPAYAEHNEKTKEMWGKLDNDVKKIVNEVRDRHKDYCDQPQNVRVAYGARARRDLGRSGELAGQGIELSRTANQYMGADCKGR